MPRVVSPEIMAVKQGKGIKSNMLYIATDTPLIITDNAWDFEYNGDMYLANGALLDVDPGAMTAGIQSNDWEFTLSAVDNSIFTSFLAQNLTHKWVYHYRAYWTEGANGMELAGVEQKKFGRILAPDDETPDNTAEATITVTSPFGDAERTRYLGTNNTSQHRRYGADDNFFQFAFETTLTIPKTAGTSGVVRSSSGGGQRDEDGQPWSHV